MLASSGSKVYAGGGKGKESLEIFTDDEIKRFVESAAKVFKNGEPAYRYGGMFVLMLNTGLKAHFFDEEAGYMIFCEKGGDIMSQETSAILKQIFFTSMMTDKIEDVRDAIRVMMDEEQIAHVEKIVNEKKNREIR